MYILVLYFHELIQVFYFIYFFFLPSMYHKNGFKKHICVFYRRLGFNAWGKLPGGLLSPDGLSMKAELLVFVLFCFRPKTNCRSDMFILAVSSPLRSPIWGAHTYRKEKTLLEVLVQFSSIINKHTGTESHEVTLHPKSKERKKTFYFALHSHCFYDN